MKKKIMSILLASTIAVTAFGLTACKDDGDGNDSDVLKSEKVSSAEAWAAAFDFTEVTNATLYYKAGNQSKGTKEVTAKRDGQKNMRLQHSESYDGDVYHDESYREHKPDELMQGYDGEMHGTIYFYSYDEDTQKWSLIKYSADRAMDWLLHEFDEVDSDYTPYRVSEHYSDFTYDENNYEYVAIWNVTVEDTTYENYKVTIKIKDGKIAEGGCSGTYKSEYNGEVVEHTITMSFKVYDVGTTVITLPNVKA